jgi:uncharacterized membrane protein YbaN (DUF454 family)
MRVFIALLLLALGILGIFLPFLPGFPFLVAFAYVVGLIDRSKFLRFIKRFQGRKGSSQRKLVSCILIRLVYGRKLNLK